jgi:hyperpolarization activated cyclic nucleotide-gated potassium channel 2
MVPFHIAFSNTLSDGEHIFEYCITLIFMSDIAVNFNTGFYNRGEYVSNRYAIAKNYLKFWFWIDFIATFPYDIMVDLTTDRDTTDDDVITDTPQLLRIFKGMRFLRMLRLMRLVKIRIILHKLEYLITRSELEIALTYFKVTLVVFFTAHGIACWFYLVSVDDSLDSDRTWICCSGVIDESVGEAYLASLYWAIATMTTVGYGDIAPVSTNEKLYSIIAMLIACAVFAYAIGMLGSVSKNLY